MPDDKKLPPEEALAKIKAAAEEGAIRFASDSLTSQYDEEIQAIFRALYVTKNGKEPKRGLWTSDGTHVGLVLDWDAEAKDYTPAAYELVTKVAAQLGIELTPKTLWTDAAAALRAKSPSTVTS